MARRSSQENKVSAEIDIALSHGDVRLWRNNVGVLRDRNGRPVAYGLGSRGGKSLPGTSDKIGLRSLLVTPQMVGRRIAIFAAIEEKDLKDPSPAQLQFIAAVQSLGGLAGVAHNVEEARAILYPEWLPAD